MRKLDYATLAQRIEAERKRLQIVWIPGSGSENERARTLASFEAFSRDVARRLSVDRIEFLKACGIE